MTTVSVKAHSRTLPSGASILVAAHRREYANGLPNKKKTSKLPEITPKTSQVWHFAVQDHYAKRAGRHFDLRLGDPKTGIAHSWAIPKHRLPAPGETLLAVRQPDHTIPYMSFVGTLRGGYGAGKVERHAKGVVEVLRSSQDVVKFTWNKNGRTSTYLLIRRGEKVWLMLNITKV